MANRLKLRVGETASAMKYAVWIPACAGTTRRPLYGFPPALERRGGRGMGSRLRGNDGAAYLQRFTPDSGIVTKLF
jgi:hypothetical protein